MFLIDDLLLLPIDGMKFVFRTLAKAAEEQWSDDSPHKEQLMELQVRLENGEVTEEEYIKEEAAILSELREVGRRKRALAGVTEEQEKELSGGLPSPAGGAESGGATFVIESNLGSSEPAIPEEHPPAKREEPKMRRTSARRRQSGAIASRQQRKAE